VQLLSQHRLISQSFMESLYTKIMENSIHRTDISRSYWYAVPPFNALKEQWTIVNECAELVATFEDKDECIEAVNAVNQLKNIKL